MALFGGKKRKKVARKRVAKKATKKARKAASKSTGKRAAKRVKRKSITPRRKRRSFMEVLKSRATKLVLGISFFAATFPSAYGWVSGQAATLLTKAQPQIGAYAEKVIDKTPIAQTGVSSWVISKIKNGSIGEVHSSGLGRREGSARTTAKTNSYNNSNKVEVVDNPFY